MNNQLLLTIAVGVTALPLLWGTLRQIGRGKFATDVVASLAIVTSMVIGQPLVGLVIVVMQAGGEALERRAAGRASEALRKLGESTPHVVHRLAGGLTEDVHPDAVHRNDLILVRPGEMIPCDGEVVGGTSHLDTSSLTGEPLPLSVAAEMQVMSGSINLEGPLTIRVLAPVDESQYAKIVALVREAQASKAPLQRVADRYATWFTPLTLVVCAAAYTVSGDWHRVLAVLAIATPCPLILATPVAILGGMNRAAKRQILIRNGGALEALGATTAVVFDKTGTITIGRPQVSRVVSLDSMSANDMLRVASAVEAGSGHLLARMLVQEADARRVGSATASEVVEAPGRGVEGNVEGMRVAVGASSYVTQRYPGLGPMVEEINRNDGGRATLRAFVTVSGELTGFVEYADMIRPGMPEVVSRLRRLGVGRMVLLSGDRAENAVAIAAAVGITDARGDMLPEDKVQVVKRLLHDGESVAMMGDGTNDAPALSTATVGVALASHGRGVATEAAEVILLADDPSRLADAIEIGRRTMRIARQSIIAGLGISAAGMLFAAAGMIPPIAGAGVQELVDLGVILNALRASRSVS